MTNSINTLSNLFFTNEYDNIIVNNEPLIPYGYLYSYFYSHKYNLEEIHNILPTCMNLTTKSFTLELPNIIYGNSNILNLIPYKNLKKLEIISDNDYTEIEDNFFGIKSNSINSIISSHKNINSFIELPTTLKIFKINETNLTKMPFFPITLTHLEITKCNLVELEYLDYLINLRILKCSFNYLNKNDWTINKLPTNIINLDLSSCYLDNIDFITHLKKLSILKINNNMINKMNLESNIGLEVLECKKNRLTSLILPDNLKILKCSYNNLKYFNKLSEKLIFLDCSNNQIVNLDNLPSKLKILNCSNNFIVNLNNLPLGLEKLIIRSNNFIVNLDNLPDGLIKLIISSLKISLMDNLPSKLKYLFIYNLGELVKLECLPNSLNKLLISGKTKFNKISNIPNNIKEILILQKNHKKLIQYNINLDINSNSSNIQIIKNKKKTKYIFEDIII